MKIRDENLQAPWVGKTPEEYDNPDCKEYVIDFVMKGRITILAKDKHDAMEQYHDMSYTELIDFIMFDDIEEVE